LGWAFQRAPAMTDAGQELSDTSSRRITTRQIAAIHALRRAERRWRRLLSVSH
jgi:hypothetical protein